MDAYNQPNGFLLSPQRTVIENQGFVETIIVNQSGSAMRPLIRNKGIRKQGLNHKRLFFWNVIVPYQGITTPLQAKTTTTPQICSAFKKTVAIFVSSLQTAFLRAD